MHKPTQSDHENRAGWKRHSRALCAGIISLGFVVSASAGGTSAASMKRATKPSFRGAPIHFAIASSYTGTYASFGASAWDGALAAAYAINKAGGINGHKLVLDKVDDYGDPVDAVPSVKKEIATQHPSVLIGESSLTTFAIEPITNAAHIPNFTAAGSLTLDTNTNPLVWRITPSDSELAAAMAIEGRHLGYKSGAILFQAGTPDNQLAPDLKRIFTHLGGKITSLQYFAVNQTSYLSEVEKALAGKPQTIFLDAPATDAATIMNDFREVNNLNDKFIGTTLTAASTFEAVVTPAVAHAHLISLTPGSQANGPAVKAFLRAYSIANHVNTKAAIVGAAAGANYVYDAVTIVALAMDHAHSSNPKVWNRRVTAVSNAPGHIVTNYAQGLHLLKEGKKINYTGASGPDTYNSHHNEFGSFDATQISTNGKTRTTLYVVSAAAAKKAST